MSPNSLPRRSFLRTGGAVTFGLLAGTALRYRPARAEDDHGALTPDEALARLMAGNARFVAGGPTYPNQSVDRRREVAGGQSPFAVVLGCSDSRVPPEVVFDAGLGDIFTVRVAGNVVDPVALGSIEFAVEEFKTPLILVLGHSECGAVKATIAALDSHAEAEGSIGSLVERVAPAVERAKDEPGELVPNAVRTNVQQSVLQVRQSPLLEHAHTPLRVVGAVYDLRTGAVELVMS